MRVHEIKTYEYDELEAAAQAKARDWYREGIEFDQFLADTVTEDFVKVARIMGFTIGQQTHQYRTASGDTRTASEPTIYWSGFGSQGDGASFDATWSRDDVDPFAAEHLKDCANTDEIPALLADLSDLLVIPAGVTCRVYHDPYHPYMHDHTMRVDGDHAPEATDEQINRDNEAYDLVLACGKCLARYLYRHLEREFEYQHEDDTIAENIRANEYEFTSDGTRFTY